MIVRVCWVHDSSLIDSPQPQYLCRENWHPRSGRYSAPMCQIGPPFSILILTAVRDPTVGSNANPIKTCFFLRLHGVLKTLNAIGKDRAFSRSGRHSGRIKPASAPSAAVSAVHGRQDRLALHLQ